MTLLYVNVHPHGAERRQGLNHLSLPPLGGNNAGQRYSGPVCLSWLCAHAGGRSVDAWKRHLPVWREVAGQHGLFAWGPLVFLHAVSSERYRVKGHQVETLVISGVIQTYTNPTTDTQITICVLTHLPPFPHTPLGVWECGCEVCGTPYAMERMSSTSLSTPFCTKSRIARLHGSRQRDFGGWATPTA